MSVASITNPSLHSSPLPKSKRGRKNPLLFHSKFSALSDPKSMAVGKQHSTKCPAFVIRVSSSATESEPSKPEGRVEEEKEEVEEEEEEKEEEKYEEYEVEIEKPYGLRFTKGRDGSTYIDAIAPETSAAKTNMFSVGDKVISTSAVFGDEIWPAAEYGRTMYTIRQRVGPLLLKMQKRYGKPIDTTELTEKEIIRAERNAGFISNRIREIQIQNYLRKKEQKEVRENDLREGLSLYKGGKYEEALEKFESVLGSKPEPEEASVANYNVACCYSKLNRVNAGLSALEDALKAGYDNFKRIRSDPDLTNVRATEEFEALMKKKMSKNTQAGTSSLKVAHFTTNKSRPTASSAEVPEIGRLSACGSRGKLSAREVGAGVPKLGHRSACMGIGTPEVGAGAPNTRDLLSVCCGTPNHTPHCNNILFGG